MSEFLFGLLHLLIGWSTEDIRVANACHRAAKKQGLRLDRPGLRQALNVPQFVSGLDGSPEMKATFQSALSGLLSPKPDSDQLIQITTALRDARLDRARGGSKALSIKEKLDRGRNEDLVRKFDSFDAASALFETHLSLVLPPRAQALRKIHSSYPRIAHLLAEILNASSSRTRLRDWATDIPSGLQSAPVDTFGVMSDLAADFGEKQAAARLIQAGLDRGLTPRPYWVVRLADLQITGTTEAWELREWIADQLDYTLAQAMLAEHGIPAAIALLGDWTTDSTAEDEFRRLLLCQLLLRERRFDEVIHEADEAYAMYTSRSAAIVAIQARVTRYELSGGNRAGEDLERALSLAQSARADRERLRLSADKEFTWELRIRRLLYDVRGALSLVADLAASPSAEELLASTEVAGEIAMLHAAAGDANLANQFLSRASGVAQLRTQAMLAERAEDESTAVELWKRVIEEADNWNDKATAALRLAFHGLKSDFVDELRAANPDIASEIELAASLFSGEPDALARARNLSRSSRAAVDFLLMYYERNGDLEQALSLALEAAQQTGSADLWLEAGRLARHLGNHAVALDATKEALARSTASWGQRKSAFRLMVEISSALGDWQSARDASGRLLAIEPDDPSAAWALTYCLIRLNQVGEAFATWRQHGRPDPYDPMSIDAWTALVREFGEQVGTPADALRFAAQFPTDQHIRDRLIGAFLLRRRPPGVEAQAHGEEGVNSDNAGAFQELIDDYIRDFPDGAIRIVTVDTEDILASIARELGEAPDTTELDEKAARGEIPIAMVAEVYNREVSTVVTRLSRFGPVFSGPSTPRGQEDVIALADGQVVLDFTAAATLTLLPEPLRVVAIGHFASVVTTLGVQADAHEALLAAERDSGMSLAPARDGTSVQISRTDDSELSELLAATTALESLLLSTTGLAHSGGLGMPELTELEWRRPGFEPLGLAISSNRALWADDRALIELARSAGLAAFTTPELLNVLTERQLISVEEHATATASLIAHGHTGVPFEAATWDMAMRLDPTHRGVLNAALFAPSDEVQHRVEWLLRLTDESVVDSLSLRSAVSVAAEWLQKVAGTEEQASRNMVQLSRLLLGRTWMSSSTLPWCLMAMRTSRMRVDAATIFLHEIFRNFEALSARASHEHAAQVFFELVSQLDTVDASRIRSAIVRNRFE